MLKKQADTVPLLTPRLERQAGEYSRLSWPETQEWKAPRNQWAARGNWTVVDKLLDAQSAQAWELKTPGESSQSREEKKMLFWDLSFPGT